VACFLAPVKASDHYYCFGTLLYSKFLAELLINRRHTKYESCSVISAPRKLPYING